MTPEIVTDEDPTAIVPVVVPLKVPVPAERVSVTVPFAPVLFTELSSASVRVTVTENGVPAVWLAIDDTTSFDAAPASTVTVELVLAVRVPA